MVKVECDGCKSTYEVEERRIPAAGLKMRCAKCGKSLLVTKEGAAAPPVAPPKRAPLSSFGDLDAIVDLPSSPRQASPPSNPDVADLPAVPAGQRPPAAGIKLAPLAPSGGRAGSPAKPRPTPDAPSGGFGDIDLPMPAAGLPVAATAGLPMAATAGLPVAADVGLPAPVAADLPARAGGRDAPPRRAPSPVHRETFGEIDMSLALGSVPPPPMEARVEPPIAAAQPPRRREQAVNEPPARAPVKAFDFEIESPARPLIPQASPAGPAGAAFREAPDTASDPFDFPLDESSLPLPDEPMKGLEIGLSPGSPGVLQAPVNPGSSASASSGAGMSFDLDLSGAPAASPGGQAASGAAAPLGGGSGLGLAFEGPRDFARDAKGKPKADEPAPESAPVPKRSIVKAAAIASVIIIGGGALTLLPDVGPFGVSFIGDRINASSHATSLAELRKKVQDDLDLDTTTSTAAAFASARAAQAQMPRHRPTAAYTAFVAFTRTFRFGRKGGEDAIGKQLLVFASTGPGEALDLATAAQALADGKLDRAKSAISYLLRHALNDVDAAVIAAEIELAGYDNKNEKEKGKAVEAWKRAVAIRKGARTLYGQARAQVAAGDLEGAEASAREAIAASPMHDGAHSLLASVLWQRGGSEAEAVDLLTKVTGKGEMKASASERDLTEALALLGEIHLARSRISAADEAFSAALKIDPQAMRALIGSGELSYRSGRYSEASARFEAASRADAANVDAMVGAAKTTLALERAKEAKDILKKARAASPANAKNTKIGYWLGRVEDALGNKKEAEAAYAEVIASDGTGPEVINAYVALTYLLSSQGRNEDAAAKLAEATSKFPERPALHKAKGDVALRTGRYEEAKAEFEAALAREDDLGTRFKLAGTLRRMRAFEEAAAMLDKIEAADKEYPGLALERGLLFEETGNRDKALAMYAAALEKAPNDLDLKLRVGSAQVIAGEVRQAEVILREVLKARPQSAEANHFLGRALLIKGVNLTEAIRFLDRAVELDPNKAEYYVYVAWAANESSQSTRVEAAITRALSLDREIADAYWQRGILLQKQGASVDALKDLQTALAKRPSRFEAYATMALCYQDLGRWPEAEEAFRKAIAGNDAVPEWRYRLGKIYMTRGNRQGAQVEIEKAIELVAASPKPPPAWLFDAHFQVAELLRTSGQGAKAVDHYKTFLATAPKENAYRADAEKALKALGAVP